VPQPRVQRDAVAAADREHERGPGDRDRADEQPQRRHRLGEGRPGGVDEQPGDGQDDQLPEGEAEQDGVLAFDVCGYPGTHRRLGIAARH